jgi:hypothetical protein
MLPPGFPRLAMKPDATGSTTCTNTMGRADVQYHHMLTVRRVGFDDEPIYCCRASTRPDGRFQTAPDQPTLTVNSHK